MGRKKRRLKNGTHFKAKPRGAVSVPNTPWNGDHGTGTHAANFFTEVRPVEDEKGRNPNRIAQRRRVNVIEKLTSLTMRQKQAAEEIQNAYGAAEKLSSGSPLKEQVDASPKPDAVITAQVDAQSRLQRAMKAVHRSERQIVEHICWHNLPPHTLEGGSHRRWMARFKASMDRVADHLQY